MYQKTINDETKETWNRNKKKMNKWKINIKFVHPIITTNGVCNQCPVAKIQFYAKWSFD